MEAYGKNVSCNTAFETLEWIKRIIEFLDRYRFFYNTHVVNFFKDRLWEAVDKDWIECLQYERTENLLQIPAGDVQDHWPASLKKFIQDSNSLTFPREQVDIEQILPNVSVAPLNTVLAQGMNMKKKHEVGILAAVVSSVARSAGAQTVVDVGAGQGYLCQALSFQYNIPVIAVDASSHHGEVTNARAERIRRHYAAKMLKSRLQEEDLNLPKIVTCHVLSSSMLKNLTCHRNHELKEEENIKKCPDYMSHDGIDELHVSQKDSADYTKTSSVLAGLHACGDLSVTMIRSFSDCKEVRALVSVGCCYSLLSEDGSALESQCGYPMSNGVKTIDFRLGKNARDLACQSAERWKVMQGEAGVQNFDLHAFRAAFQMILDRYYPEVLPTSPTIGRQGKALRRKHQRKSPTSETEEKSTGVMSSVDKFNLFKEFCESGLHRLGLEMREDIDLPGVWKELKSFLGLVGPYWSLRAALGPVLETFILLDRLLCLQEQGSSIKVMILPIFDPVLSPRNMAIIAHKS